MSKATKSYSVWTSKTTDGRVVSGPRNFSTEDAAIMAASDFVDAGCMGATVFMHRGKNVHCNDSVAAFARRTNPQTGEALTVRR